MAGHIDCPVWCAEDVADAAGVQHQVVIGEVRLTRLDRIGGRLTVCSVRRRARRTPAQVALLGEDIAAASHLLRGEHGMRRVRFRDNHVVQDSYAAPAMADVALG